MTVCALFVVSFFLLKNLPLLIKKSWEQDKNQKQNLMALIKKLLTIVINLLQEYEIIYYISYGTLAVLGTSVHPFFFAFHLTEILIRYPTLKNVIRAVWEPKESLWLLLMLLLILEYVSAIISFLFFQADFEDGESKFECKEMLICFLQNFDQTFKVNSFCLN